MSWTLTGVLGEDLSGNVLFTSNHTQGGNGTWFAAGPPQFVYPTTTATPVWAEPIWEQELPPQPKPQRAIRVRE